MLTLIIVWMAVRLTGFMHSIDVWVVGNSYQSSRVLLLFHATYVCFCSSKSTVLLPWKSEPNLAVIFFTEAVLKKFEGSLWCFMIHNLCCYFSLFVFFVCGCGTCGGCRGTCWEEMCGALLTRRDGVFALWLFVGGQV